MIGVTGMEKKGRGARARERRRDLAADQSRLPHSGHNHFATAAVQQLNGPDKTIIQSIHERQDALRLDVQDVFRPL